MINNESILQKLPSFHSVVPISNPENKCGKFQWFLFQQYKYETKMQPRYSSNTRRRSYIILSLSTIYAAKMFRVGAKQKFEDLTVVETKVCVNELS